MVPQSRKESFVATSLEVNLRPGVPSAAVAASATALPSAPILPTSGMSRKEGERRKPSMSAAVISFAVPFGVVVPNASNFVTSSGRSGRR
jgi:hypothetical protein